MIASGRSLPESMQAMGIEAVDDSRPRRPLPPTAGGQSEDRRRSEGRQAQGPRPTDRPGEEEESQRQSQPGPRTVPELDRKDVSIITLDHRFRHRQPVRGGDEGRDPLAQPGGDARGHHPRRAGPGHPPRGRACWRKSPTASRRARSTWRWSIRAWARTGRSSTFASAGSSTSRRTTGCLSRVIAKMPPSKIIRLAEPRFWLDDISTTFHGRDIMAPVAARLSLGLEPDQLGPPLERLIVLEWPRAQLMERRIAGHVIEIDSFGNLVTNITAEMFAGRPTDARVCIVCNIYETWGVYLTYAQQPQGTLVALVGSSGRLELAIVGDNAAASARASSSARPWPWPGNESECLRTHPRATQGLGPHAGLARLHANGRIRAAGARTRPRAARSSTSTATPTSTASAACGATSTAIAIRDWTPPSARNWTASPTSRSWARRTRRRSAGEAVGRSGARRAGPRLLLRRRRHGRGSGPEDGLPVLAAAAAIRGRRRPATWPWATPITATRWGASASAASSGSTRCSARCCSRRSACRCPIPIARRPASPREDLAAYHLEKLERTAPRAPSADRRDGDRAAWCRRRRAWSCTRRLSSRRPRTDAKIRRAADRRRGGRRLRPHRADVRLRARSRSRPTCSAWPRA